MQLTYVMTPALKPNADAKTRRDANFTRDGIKTTAAPKAVENPAPITKANANPTFGLETVMTTIKCGSKGGYGSVTTIYQAF